MATIASGLVGGLLGAIATAAALSVVDDDPSPASVVWAMYFGDGDPTHYAPAGTVVHLVYGALVGVVFVGLVGGSALATLGGALLWAVLWSAVLFLVAVGFWMRVIIGAETDTEVLTTTAGVHLVFAVVLALWVSFVPGL